MGSKYTPISDLEKFGAKFHDVSPARSSTSESLGSTLLEDEDRMMEPSRPWSPRLMFLGHIVLLSLSFVMFVGAFMTRASTLTHVKQFSAYSPAREAVEYEVVRFNATMGEGSPYVGASPEVDAAWRAITYDVGDQVISNAEREMIGMPADHIKAIHPKTGVEGYRITYKDYYEELGGNFASGPEELKMHADHCLEILRKNIECSADIGVFTLYLLEGDPLPWPELNTNHVCRNFDKVREWALDNSIGNMEHATR